MALGWLVSSEEIEGLFAVSLKWKQMHIKRLANSSVLKRGELLIVLKCSKRYHDDAFIDSLKGTGAGVIQFYRYRQEPVPGVRRWKNGKCFRHPRTTNERRVNCATRTTREILENHGVAFKVRRKRMPTTYDDIFHRYQRSWKEYRKTQPKVVGPINRRIHSPPFWDWSSNVLSSGLKTPS